MKEIHSYWAYIVLIILVITVVNAFVGIFKKKEFKSTDLRLGLFTLIVSHLQLLIGFAWYFMSPWYKTLKNSSSEAMGDKAVRLLAVEHPLMMVLAIVLITIGWSKHKKQTTDAGKFKTFALFYGLALVFILVRIPWSNWFA